VSFIKTWTPYFSSSVRMRGRAIQTQEFVKLQPKQPGEVARATVQGTQLYTVIVRDHDASCTCPHYADGYYCKHIWATLLELKHQPHFDETTAQAVEELSESQLRLPKAKKRTSDSPSNRRREPEWVSKLSLVRAVRDDEISSQALPATPQQICYVISQEMSVRHKGVVVELHQREMNTAGWSRLKVLKLSSETVGNITEPSDRELCAMLLGGTWVSGYDSGNFFSDERARSSFRLPSSAWRALLKRMIETGRCYLEDNTEGPPMTWDDGEPWVLWLTGDLDRRALQVNVELRRGHDRMPIEQPTLILGGSDGLLISRGEAAIFDDRDAFRWVMQFREELHYQRGDSAISVPLGEVDQFVERLYMLEQLPEIDLPEGVGQTPVKVKPTPHIAISRPSDHGRSERLTAEVWFEYGAQRVQPGQAGRFVSAPNTSAPMRRDLRFERNALEKLFHIGLRPQIGNGADKFSLSSRQLSRCVTTLLTEGWQVTADRRAIRRAGPPRLSVTSGVDWFELHGTISYETEDGVYDVRLPDILAAAKSGRNLIELGDGSQGLLPEQWLEEHGLLTAIGQLEGDHIRFRATQAALLDALLDQQELVSVDERFAETRKQLQQFEGIETIEPASTFVGSLRSYQSDALGWFKFLRWFGMGGILADDMGLGKTVQVLAMLDAWYGACRDDGQPHRPTLIVVPRSVMFNWLDEASHFTPKLRVQAYTGIERDILRERFGEHDVIVTTYGLLRRDAQQLIDHEFEYAVLDEAQAIKNPNSQAAKAARLIRTQHRLALTGTPVENHMGDLWSIFEYLNPGMLGSNSRFGQLVRSTASQPRMALDDLPSEESQTEAAQATWQVAQALKPFILRRTKQEVLKDLPEKTEQTIICEMEGEQLKSYQQLREHYRGTLLRQYSAEQDKTIWQSEDGSTSGMMVLEALLRLRQAACHPGLIDPARNGETSAKLEALLDSLVELIDEGHKALVFSQFTSMLSIVRDRLDQKGIKYAYLDGKTRKRKQAVDHFQSDPDCPVFLISLKAGGLGLNLTAAEYVFILDPWWNPAVEQQAIDRAHRIGQTRPVFAYRLICQDTIEQRIAQLQDKKRKLADAIVGGQKSLLRSLTRDDLDMLLS
jgi:superfamily II DNA or RNA helicase